MFQTVCIIPMQCLAWFLYGFGPGFIWGLILKVTIIKGIKQSGSGGSIFYGINGAKFLRYWPVYMRIYDTFVWCWKYIKSLINKSVMKWIVSLWPCYRSSASRIGLRIAILVDAEGQCSNPRDNTTGRGPVTGQYENINLITYYNNCDQSLLICWYTRQRLRTELPGKFVRTAVLLWHAKLSQIG